MEASAGIERLPRDRGVYDRYQEVLQSFVPYLGPAEARRIISGR